MLFQNIVNLRDKGGILSVWINWVSCVLHLVQVFLERREPLFGKPAGYRGFLLIVEIAQTCVVSIQSIHGVDASAKLLVLQLWVRHKVSHPENCEATVLHPLLLVVL